MCPRDDQRSPNLPEFAQPGLGRSNGSHSQQEGTILGVFVPVWLVLPWCDAANLGVFDCVISTYSNGAVQIRVCLELAEMRRPGAVVVQLHLIPTCGVW